MRITTLPHNTCTSDENGHTKHDLNKRDNIKMISKQLIS